MVNLGLIELSLKRITNKTYAESVSNQKYRITAKDITRAFSEGNIKLDTKYTLIFLYDYFSDTKSKEFLEDYGAKIHNDTSANISFITYLSEDIINSWKNVQCRDNIVFQEINQTFYEESFKELKEIFDIKTFPALIIIKNTKEKDEHFITYLDSYSKINLYNVIKEVIGIINENCEEDFDIIVRKIAPNQLKKINTVTRFNLFNKIGELVKKESKHRRYTCIDLATELNISPRTLTNKRNNNSFTREQCIYMAFKFKLSYKELKELLVETNNKELTLDGRDGKIRKILQDKEFLKSLEPEFVADEKLIEAGFEGIINNY